MLSAARYPVVLYGPLRLPFILPHDAMLYAVLRKAHTALAYLFFLTFLAHFGAILYHTLIVRDGLLMRMAPWNRGPQGAALPDVDRSGKSEFGDPPLGTLSGEASAVQPLS